ncbi:hypothetical protein H9P43_009794 [Blastocladiella emersonii ATCC 22665]|nr:hypothetical protein H9P43_009794 [Blastocladiella emersonii ATCC 22665]
MEPPLTCIDHSDLLHAYTTDPADTAPVFSALAWSLAWTACELHDRVVRVQRGDVVAVALPLCPDLVLACLALFRLCAVVPNGVRVWVLAPADAGDASAVDFATNGPLLALKDSGSGLSQSVWSQAVAYLVQTSGTTRFSPTHRTSVAVPRASFSAHLDEFRSAWPSSASTVVALATVPTFDPHLIELFHAVTTGRPFVLARTLREAVSAGCTLLSTTPSRLFLELTPETVAAVLRGTTSVTHLYLGGEGFPYARLVRLVPHAEWAIAVGNLYGTTECSVWGSLHFLQPALADVYAAHGVPVTPPLARTELRVEDGQVVLGGPRRACFVNGVLTEWDRTGDAALELDGHIIVSGRLGRQIKRWGHRVQLEAIEAVASRVPGAGHACALQLDDGDLVLVVAPPTVLLDDIRHAFAAAGLPRASYPDRIVHYAAAPALPLTPNGKVDARAVRNWVSSLPRTTTTVSPTRAARDALDRVLGGADWRPDDYFVRAGGSSVGAMQVLQRVVTAAETNPAGADEVRTRLFRVLMHEPVAAFLDASPLSAAAATSPPSSSPSDLATRPSPRLAFTSPPLRVCDLGKCVDAPAALCPLTRRAFLGSHAGQWCTLDPLSPHTSLLTYSLPPHPYRPGHPVRIEAGLTPYGADAVLIATSAGELHCVDWRTGVVEWTHALGREPVKSAPVADAVAASTSGTLACLVPGSRTPKWTTDAGAPVFATPAFDAAARELVVASVNSLLVLDAATGSMRRRTDLTHPVFSAPVLLPRDRFAHGTHGGEVHVRSRLTLEVVARIRAPSAVFGRVAVVGEEMVVFACTDGSVCLARTDTGEVTDVVVLPGQVFSAPAAVGGKMVVVGCRDDGVYALEVGGGGDVS